MHIKVRRRLTATARLLMFSIALTGCTQISNTATNNPTQSEPKVFRIAHQKGGLLTLARLRKQLETTLASQNIKVEWVGPFDRCAPLLQAITARSADLGLCGDIAVLSGLAADMPLCTAAVRLPIPKGEAILVRKDSTIRTPADLIGKKVVANTGGWGEHLTRRVLDEAKVSEGKVELVNLPPSDALPALIEGHVDAWTVWEPYVSIAKVEHGVRSIASGDAAPHYLFYPVSQEVAEKQPEVLKTVLAAVKQEGDWQTQNPAQAAEIYSKELKLAPEVGKSFIANNSPETLVPFSPKIIADVQKSADWLVERKVITKPVNFASKVCQRAIAN